MRLPAIVDRLLRVRWHLDCHTCGRRYRVWRLATYLRLSDAHFGHHRQSGPPGYRFPF